MFLQFPILIVLYDVVRGLAKTADILNAKGQKTYLHGKLRVSATPQNIPKTSRMYRDLVAAHGQMHVLGINPRIQCAPISRMWLMSSPTWRSF